MQVAKSEIKDYNHGKARFVSWLQLRTRDARRTPGDLMPLRCSNHIFIPFSQRLGDFYITTALKWILKWGEHLVLIAPWVLLLHCCCQKIFLARGLFLKADVSPERCMKTSLSTKLGLSGFNDILHPSCACGKKEPCWNCATVPSPPLGTGHKVGMRCWSWF